MLFLNQYIYYINFATIWVIIAEKSIKPRKTKKIQGGRNQTRPKPNINKIFQILDSINPISPGVLGPGNTGGVGL